MINRRDILKSMGLIGAASSLTGIAFAQAQTDARFVLIILRGAVDGLAMIAPYGDANYRKVRGELAMMPPGTDSDEASLLQLDGLFGMHPAFATTHKLFLEGQVLPVHAVASPYRDRSHFDGQDVLENGVTTAGLRRDGWLNRALAPLDARLDRKSAIAVASNTPLVLQGESPVSNWAPSQLPDADDSTMQRIATMYADDEFFASRFQQALEAQEIASLMPGDGKRRRGNDRKRSKEMMQAAARFLRNPDGPRIAVLESGGWDTHANQGSASGQLANKFAGLDQDLDALRLELGPNWNNTVVVVVTEFGRTVKVNGTRGTDHGTATAALVLGGAVNGGRILSDWPGLADGDLYQGRDLRATLDLRSVFKGVLAEHLELPEGYLEEIVFPQSNAVRPVRDIVRA